MNADSIARRLVLPALLVLPVLLAVPAVAHAQIVITEVLYAPAGGSEADWEWIEIHNAGDTTVDFDGWVVDDADDIPQAGANISGRNLAPGGTAVLVSDAVLDRFNAAWPGNMHLLAVSGWEHMRLDDPGDRIALWRTVADYSGDHTRHLHAAVKLAYTAGGAFPPAAAGRSIYIQTHTLDAADGASWNTAVAGEGDMLVSSGTDDYPGGDVGGPGVTDELAALQHQHHQLINGQVPGTPVQYRRLATFCETYLTRPDISPVEAIRARVLALRALDEADAQAERLSLAAKWLGDGSAERPEVRVLFLQQQGLALLELGRQSEAADVLGELQQIEDQTGLAGFGGELARKLLEQRIVQTPTAEGVALSGERHELPGDFGGQHLLLDFWSDLPPSRALMTEFVSRMHHKWGGTGLNVVGVSRASAEEQREFLDNRHYGWTHIVDENGSVAAAWGVQAVPYLVLIDSSGETVVAGPGWSVISQIVAWLEEKLGPLGVETITTPDTTGGIMFPGIDLPGITSPDIDITTPGPDGTDPSTNTVPDAPAPTTPAGPSVFDRLSATGVELPPIPGPEAVTPPTVDELTTASLFDRLREGVGDLPALPETADPDGTPAAPAPGPLTSASLFDRLGSGIGELPPLPVSDDGDDD